MRLETHLLWTEEGKGRMEAEMQGVRQQRKEERTEVYFVVLVLNQTEKNSVCI